MPEITEAPSRGSSSTRAWPRWAAARSARIQARPSCRARSGSRPLAWRRGLQEIVDEAVRRAYTLDTNPLRTSIVRDPLGGRINSGDNTPAMVQAELVAVGGTAFLVAQAIRAARCVAWHDLGLEAIYESRVEEMPVTVALDSRRQHVHSLGPERWRRRTA